MPTPFLGEIRPVAFDYAPAGWRLCDGSKLPIKGNELLHAILGGTFGGDGKTYFNLPDLRGRTPVHVSSRGGSATTSNPGQLGYKGGAESITLSVDQLPTHRHRMQGAAVANDGGERSPEAAVFTSARKRNVYSSQVIRGDHVVLNEKSVQVLGGGLSHENMQEYTTLNYIIAIDGRFPERPPGGELSIYQTLYDGAVQIVEFPKHGQYYSLSYTLVNDSQDVLQLAPMKILNEDNVFVQANTDLRRFEPGEIVEFLLTCYPQSIGGFSFDVELEYVRLNTHAPNSPSEPPIFNKRFSVEGTLTEGRIAVETMTGKRVSLNEKDFQGFNLKPGRTYKIGYRIKNTAKAGGGDLVLGEPSYGDESKITSVTIRPLSSNAIEPGQSEELAISYVPSGLPADNKPFRFTINIPYTSSGEQKHFSFSVTGSADSSSAANYDEALELSTSAGLSNPDSAQLKQYPGAPEITVLATIRNQATFRQRAVGVGEEVNVLLTYMPPGALGVNLYQPSITSPHNVTQENVSPPSPSNLGPEERGYSTLTYTPVAVGPYQLQINQGRYSFLIKGEAVATAPLMTLEKEGGGPIAKGGKDMIGSVPVNQTQTLKYVISNSGNMDLKLTSYSVIEQASATAAIIKQPGTIKAGGAAEMVVQVTPTTTLPPDTNFNDVFAVIFQIESNDADASPFMFMVTGDETST